MIYKNITALNLNPLLDYLTKRLPDDKTLVICQNDKVLDKCSTKDIKLESLLIKGPLKDTYTIYLRKGAISYRTICHEFVHLTQMLKGYLEVNEKEGTFVWKGVKYDSSYPYNKRPWEREAFGQQDKIYREYRRSLKQNRVKV